MGPSLGWIRSGLVGQVSKELRVSWFFPDLGITLVMPWETFPSYNRRVEKFKNCRQIFLLLGKSNTTGGWHGCPLRGATSS